MSISRQDGLLRNSFSRQDDHMGSKAFATATRIDRQLTTDN